jgi:DNA-binding MarR family transcriptional regulator
MEAKDTAEKLPFVDEYYSLWLLLSQTRSAIFKARHKMLGKYVHFNQAAALVIIWTMHGRVTPAVLARYLFLEPHSVSELIIRMEKKGLVKKSRDKQRENIVRLTLTAKGQQFCRQAVQEDFIRGIMSSLTGKQREQLRSYLSVLYRAALKSLGMEEPLPLTTNEIYL